MKCGTTGRWLSRPFPPLEIRISDADPANDRLYFGTGPRPGMMIVVVADITQGFIKTAHLIKVTKGALEWSRPTP